MSVVRFRPWALFSLGLAGSAHFVTASIASTFSGRIHAKQNSLGIPSDASCLTTPDQEEGEGELVEVD